MTAPLMAAVSIAADTRALWVVVSPIRRRDMRSIVRWNCSSPAKNPTMTGSRSTTLIERRLSTARATIPVMSLSRARLRVGSASASSRTPRSLASSAWAAARTISSLVLNWW